MPLAAPVTIAVRQVAFGMRQAYHRPQSKAQSPKSAENGKPGTENGKWETGQCGSTSVARFEISDFLFPVFHFASLYFAGRRARRFSMVTGSTASASWKPNTRE